MRVSKEKRRSDAHVAYDELPSSPREIRSTPMTTTKNNVPPSSTLVMTALVLRTSPSRKPSTLRSFSSPSEYRAYTLRSALSASSSSTLLGEQAREKAEPGPLSPGLLIG